MSSGKVVELARLILEQATKYEEHFLSNNLERPSLDAAAFPEPSLPEVVLDARAKVLQATSDLQALVRGPSETIRHATAHHTHLISLQAIYQYNIDVNTPQEGDISFTELSKKCGLNESDLRRFVRYAATCHIFTEPRKGFLAHNGPSKAMAEVPELRAWVGLICDELWPAAAKTMDAVQKWPASQEPTQAGFQLAHNTKDPMFVEYSKTPARLQRFAQAMSTFSISSTAEPARLISAYPWATLGKGEKATLVDMGGSFGSASIVLAEQFPNLRCIVQDLPGTIAKTKVPAGLEDRITFMAHDFFTEQSVVADVYFFRFIFHDWSDKYCVLILKNLVPALKPGALILINEFVLPESGATPSERERSIRSFDLVMLSIQNSKERDAEDWEVLFKEADPRFQFQGIKQQPGSKALIQVGWKV